MEVELSSQAQPLGWTVEKAHASVRNSTYDLMSAISGPDFYGASSSEAGTQSKHASGIMNVREPVFQSKYCSSEEALSPMDMDMTDDEFDSEDFTTAEESIPDAEEKEPECAIRMSIIQVGPAKVISVPASPTSPTRPASRLRPEPIQELPSRSSSLANLKQQPAKAVLVRPAINTNISSSSVSTSYLASAEPESSSSGRTSEDDFPPAPQYPAPRAPLSVNTNVTNMRHASLLSPTSAAPTSTPNSILQTPASMTYKFLDSDPNQTSSSNSSPNKSHPSRSRLRSIANVARVMTKKTKNESDVPATLKKSRRNSSISLTGNYKANRSSTMSSSDLASPTLQQTIIHYLPTPSPEPTPTPRKKAARMVARGAAEREPTVELPPFPSSSEDLPSNGTLGRSRRVRKRRSFMDL